MELENHPNRTFCEHLLDGFIQGFDTGLTSLPKHSYECANLLSAKNQPPITMELLNTELERGYAIGPFDRIPFEQYRISPLGVAESKYSKKKRLIVDLSAPHDNEKHPSLNELINKEDFSLSYVTIDTAVQIIRRLGKGAWMCKTDIKDAFKLIPIKEALWPYYGVKWNGKYYFYTRLVFGGRSSPKIFDSLSEAVCWILEHNYKLANVLHLLDDFLAIDSPEADADRTMAVLTLVFNKLGIPLSLNKTVGPVTELEYLGIILDSTKMEARLPMDKVDRIRNVLISFLNRKSCTKQELLSLLGHLNLHQGSYILGELSYHI
ncbi:MAG: reverse transcriptase domain-containing protein [Candidatus Thiodiazotropha taylori]